MVTKLLVWIPVSPLIVWFPAEVWGVSGPELVSQLGTDIELASENETVEIIEAVMKWYWEIRRFWWVGDEKF